jgi:hypothetical protein
VNDPTPQAKMNKSQQQSGNWISQVLDVTMSKLSGKREAQKRNILKPALSGLE